MAVYGYTKNYKLIKPQFDTDTWHDYEYDNLDTIDAVLSAIFASGDWQGFWKTNTHYDAGGVVIDRDTDTMYKIMVEHTTSEATFAEEFAAHPTYYELWSPNNLAEDWAIKMDGMVSNTDYSSKAYAISSALIDNGSAKEWAIKTGGSIGTTGEYSAKKHATDAASSASTAIAQASAASASATLAQQWAVDANLVASTDYSSKSWATGSLDAGSAKDWAIKEGGQVGTTGKYSAKVYSLAAQNHYEKAVDWASKTNGLVEETDYSAKAYAISEGLISDGSAKEWSNKAKAWATSSSIVEDGKYGSSYYALQAYNANVSAQAAKTTAQEWASKMDGQVASTDYSSKYYATQSATDAGNSHIWAEGTDEQVQALGGTHSSKVWAEQSTNANIALTNSPYTTNRILEIPQDIKLELNNGTLTLKAGSKVYVPNGFESDGTTPKFDIVTISQNQTSSKPTATYSRLVFVYNPNSPSDFSSTSEVACFSGHTAPSAYNIMIWYDTSTNLVKVTTNQGNTWSSGYSLPYAIASTTASDGFVSIDQIFNGFGYIGSTVFLLPGVKFEYPDGFNTDGTYKSIISVQENVATVTINTTYPATLIRRSNGILTYAYLCDYNAQTNHNRYDGDTDFSGNFFGKVIVDNNSKILSSVFYQVDSVANSNASNFSQAGRSYLSGIGAPDINHYVDLTLGANGSAYVAPANGYFAIDRDSSSGNYISLQAYNSSNQEIYGTNTAIEGGGRLTLPALKGTTVKVGYIGSMTLYYFHFVYAVGEANV